MRGLARAVLCAALLSGCASVAEVEQRQVELIPLGEAAYDHPPEPEEVPVDVADAPEPVPRSEPRSRSGNAPVYQVFGKTYHVLDKADGFREQGIASWYGKRFHGRQTASGEIYDMYAMTAAHKSLPLPSYVRVTHRGNGRSVIVRVNDRGPFYPGRIIDLSYAAAAKLDMVNAGRAQVEIEALVPLEAPPAGEGFLQVAAYADPINAVSMREELSRFGVSAVQIWTSETSEEPMHRVVIGPFDSEGSAHPVRESLLSRGLQPAWVLR